MKTITKFWLLNLACAIVLLLSCEPNEKSESYSLTIDSPTITLAATGEEMTLNVTANVYWTVEITSQASEWLNFDPKIGKESGIITVSAAENQNANARIATLSIMGEGVEPVSVTVTQEGSELSAPINFVDENFKNGLLVVYEGTPGEQGYIGHIPAKIDANGDGEISLQEAEAVTQIQVYTREIADMSDLMFFPNLEILSCGGNNLTELDLSYNTKLKELYAYDNDIATVDLSKNSELEYISIYFNQLSTLDVTNNPKLTYLNAIFNTYITEIDLSKNVMLKDLWVAYMSSLLVLDVSKLTELEVFVCATNSLTELDVSKNTKLTKLDMSGNMISTIDLSNNALLQEFVGGVNLLTNIDLSNNNNLRRISIDGNQLTSITLPSNPEFLTEINLQANELTEINLNMCSALTYLDCYDNKITNLYLGDCPNLVDLYCHVNKMTSLNITDNPNIGFSDGAYTPLHLLCGAQLSETEGEVLPLTLTMTPTQIDNNIISLSEEFNAGVTIQTEAPID